MKTKHLGMVLHTSFTSDEDKESEYTIYESHSRRSHDMKLHDSCRLRFDRSDNVYIDP